MPLLEDNVRQLFPAVIISYQISNQTLPGEISTLGSAAGRPMTPMTHNTARALIIFGRKETRAACKHGFSNALAFRVSSDSLVAAQAGVQAGNGHQAETR
ncbi:hypothetical protein J3458_000873 [Metarhizium acridum]|uniref:uncharacterized protein n=1 Tax=Metarhizium acridum TaxID=92637 RepID=UPI001C6C294B|nr:hypothetical protein J3458_000873 [Metarhizium acridum]